MPFRYALAIRYAIFAIAATFSNLGAQSACLALYEGPEQVDVSIVLGTIVGFFVKYALDKHFIFFDERETVAREIGKVALYGVTAVGTTLIFWSLELGCWMIWQTSFAKYCGAIVGLGLGYLVKYLLDSRYVFAKTVPA